LPSFRRSESIIAMACLRDLTFGPRFEPLRSDPPLYSDITSLDGGIDISPFFASD
jgi:hypothetical protein